MSDKYACVAYSANGKHIAFDSIDKTVRVWDAQTGAAAGHGEPLIGHTDPVSSVAYSPDGNYTVSGSEDEPVRIWDANLTPEACQAPHRLPEEIRHDEWFSDSSGGLLLSVPLEYRVMFCDRLIICISTERQRITPKVNWEKFYRYSGTSWVEIVADGKAEMTKRSVCIRDTTCSVWAKR